MPKQEKSHKTKSYTRVTPRTLNRFRYFQAEDTTNLTTTSRNTSSYARKLGIKCLKTMLIDLAIEKGRKITILDSGCGQGVAIDELLSDETLEPYIKHISGISLHYFENIERLMEKHPTRFYYYLGTTQDVLSTALETHCGFDLILDVWGAYPYSEDKLALLKQYHQALLPHGVAHVYQGRDDLFVNNGHECPRKQRFTGYATRDFPETFLPKHPPLGISIKKSTARWPLPDMNIMSSKEQASIGVDYALTPSTLKQLRQGNAVKYSKVVIDDTEEQPMKLRPLPSP